MWLAGQWYRQIRCEDSHDGYTTFDNIGFYNNVITGDNVTAMIGFLVKPQEP